MMTSTETINNQQLENRLTLLDPEKIQVRENPNTCSGRAQRAGNRQLILPIQKAPAHPNTFVSFVLFVVAKSKTVEIITDTEE
jgi:hypothetical protein